jgi:hypothetical protein
MSNLASLLAILNSLSGYADCAGYPVCAGYAGWICCLGYIYMPSMLIMLCGYAKYAVKFCCLTSGYAAYAGYTCWI